MPPRTTNMCPRSSASGYRGRTTALPEDGEFVGSGWDSLAQIQFTRGPRVRLVDVYQHGGRESTDAALAPPVMGVSTQDMIAKPELGARGPRWRSNTFSCSSAKNNSIVTLSPQPPTRPIEPRNWWALEAVTNLVDRKLHPGPNAHRPPRTDSVARLCSAGRRRPGDLHPRVDRGADDPTGVDVFDRTHAEPALVSRMLSEIGQPHRARRESRNTAAQSAQAGRPCGSDRPRQR